MNVYDIALTVALYILVMTLLFVVDYFKDKIKELEDKTVRLRIKNHGTDFTLKRLEDNIYTLMDKVYKQQKVKDRADKKIGVGKWIRFESDGTHGISYWYGCSICGNKVPKSQYGIDYFSPYCPACGAQMEFESEVEK